MGNVRCAVKLHVAALRELVKEFLVLSHPKLSGKPPR